MPLLEVDNLTVRYPTRHSPALQGVSFSAAQGESLLILGPSGSGKSTLALCLNGLIPHRIKAEFNGHVILDGQDTRAPDVNPAELSQQAGIVFQNPQSQFSTLTVADEVAFGLENLAVPHDQMDTRIDAALARVELLDQRHRRLDRLSGGQKQRVALACLLAADTPILIFDEPTSLLDPDGVRRFYRVIETLLGERTLIFIEHNLYACIHLADRVLLLDREGNLTADGPPRSVFANHSRQIQEAGIWLPPVTELALQIETPGTDAADLPLTLGEAREHFKLHLPLSAPSPDESSVSEPLAAPDARAFVLDKLSYTYPDGTLALDEVSLSLPAGEFLALLGPNGAGKTTLAMHLAGIIQPEAGVLRLFGLDSGEYSTTAIAERVGFVFQNPERQFIIERTDSELAFSLRTRRKLRGKGKHLLTEGVTLEERVEQLLEQLDLVGLGPANPFTLSQGQKRRLSMGTMLTVTQRLLLLDEPAYGQDPQSTRHMMRTLQELNRRGVTIIMITQDMRLVANYTHSAALLVDGRLLYHGPTRALFRNSDLLAEARLRPPSLYALSARLRRIQFDFPDLMTVSDYETAIVRQDT